MADQPSGSYELITLLALTFSAVVEELHRQLKVMGYDDVRPAHGFAFVRLTPAGATGNELAEYLGVTKQAASHMIDYLEERGYVERQPYPGDARGKLVVLTTRGWGCIAATESIFSEIERRWAALVGVEQMNTLRLSLRRFVYETSNGGAPQRLRPVW